jgi:peptide deformylase
MNIMKYGSKIIRKVSSKVDGRNFPIREYAPLLERILHVENAKNFNIQGVSCPQINESKRMFAIRTPSFVGCLVNPVIVEYSDDKLTSKESVVTLPGFLFEVQRSNTIRVEYTSDRGKKIKSIFEGDTSFAIQQMIDSLDGVLPIDYLGKKEYESIEDKLESIITSRKSNPFGEAIPTSRPSYSRTGSIDFGSTGITSRSISGIYGSSGYINGNSTIAIDDTPMEYSDQDIDEPEPLEDIATDESNTIMDTDEFMKSLLDTLGENPITSSAETTAPVDEELSVNNSEEISKIINQFITKKKRM